MTALGRFLTGGGLVAGSFAAFLLLIERAGETGNTETAVLEVPALRPGEGMTAAPVLEEPSGQPGHPANAGLRINEAGLEIIRRSEGLRLEAYQVGGRWYIGYGHSGAHEGMTITRVEADAFLREDVRDAENGVRRLVSTRVNENEFSAMVSLAFNLGVGAFGRSAVLSHINQGDRPGAADAFRNYVRAGGKVNQHLQHRREEERELFLTPV